MNLDGNNVTSFQELLEEKQKLQLLIQNQKNIIRHDLQELRIQFTKQIKPAIDAGKFVRKITAAQESNKTLLSISAGFAIDVLTRKLLRNSNLLVRTLLPLVAKNFSNRFFSKKLTDGTANRRSALDRQV
jgi:hypothetical protein